MRFPGKFQFLKVHCFISLRAGKGKGEEEGMEGKGRAEGEGGEEEVG